MIDIANEKLHLLIDAIQYVPGHPHLSTLMRWKSSGVRGVKLDTVLVGGRRYTSVEAIQRFIARCSGQPETCKEAKMAIPARN
jgi:hypothetical protein